MSECMLKRCKLHELHCPLEEEWRNTKTEPKQEHLFEGGSFFVAGELCVDPFEMEVDLLKAKNAEEWILSVMVRHLNRVQSPDEALTVIARIA